MAQPGSLSVFSLVSGLLLTPLPCPLPLPGLTLTSACSQLPVFSQHVCGSLHPGWTTCWDWLPPARCHPRSARGSGPAAT